MPDARLHHASLEVEDGNEGAIALYAALGFTEVGRRRGYYGVGKDAIVMTAPLPLVLPVDNASPEPTAAEQRVWPLPALALRGERAEIERRRWCSRIESSCGRDGRGDYRCGWQYAGQPGVDTD